ncbi:SDR family oxidoreductase [Holzapfeliella floricola]|uniref:NAD(P)-binding domain-containing protein n=1 Tax=Holzapfeliella floricola DSM 23037 = JCM 16512 TaxID=1423744 RepID=A0A0R2DUM1_9LACO|nr:SDR family oxidoreductase [Holzapfeliella floricola]KRN04663.1 hypothetical protein FC86_GL000112 [Holzapfeliella floricola DSM 23037 = JCM 16512]
MKVFVAGANGRVGRHVVNKLIQKDDDVLAGVRDPKTQSILRHDHVAYVPFNLHQDINQMVEAFSNSDAVIFTAGSAGKDVAKVDLDGAVKTMKAAEKAGIKRYIMVSAVNADHPETWPGQSLHDYYIGKHYADEWLKQTDLDYVIVQPVTLSDKPATGEISSDYAKLSDDISREDVAEFLAQVVRKQSANRLTVDISNGDEAIHEVISDL